jgi:AcrR family transcriptional regulator
MDGSATFTIDASITTTNWVIAKSIRARFLPRCELRSAAALRVREPILVASPDWVSVVLMKVLSRRNAKDNPEAEVRFLLFIAGYGAKIPFVKAMATDQRTLRADARRNHERIMTSGRELFARDGPEAQMDEIAARAGVGIGTVYRHFPTKEALLTAMVRERFQEFAEIATLAEDTVDPREALETVMRRSAEAVEGDMGFQLAMMGSNQLEWEGIEEQKAVLAAVVTRIISRAVAAGAVRDDFGFDDFAMVMCGTTATMYFKPGSADWRRYLDMMLQGIRAS